MPQCQVCGPVHMPPQHSGTGLTAVPQCFTPPWGRAGWRVPVVCDVAGKGWWGFEGLAGMIRKAWKSIQRYGVVWGRYGEISNNKCKICLLRAGTWLLYINS